MSLLRKKFAFEYIPTDSQIITQQIDPFLKQL